MNDVFDMSLYVGETEQSWVSIMGFSLRHLVKHVFRVNNNNIILPI
jgi:hypothetical protein